MKPYKDQFTPHDLSYPPSVFSIDGAAKTSESISAWRTVNDWLWNIIY